jgi:hypothetical protein
MVGNNLEKGGSRNSGGRVPLPPESCTGPHCHCWQNKRVVGSLAYTYTTSIMQIYPNLVVEVNVLLKEAF